jgi:hypothetical protein
MQSIPYEQIGNSFYLPVKLVKEHLDKYYILHWKGDYLVSQVADSMTRGNREDCIKHQGVKYKVRYLEGLSAWKVLMNKEAQYKISFRKLKGSSNGYALIKSSKLSTRPVNKLAKGIKNEHICTAP